MPQGHGAVRYINRAALFFLMVIYYNALMKPKPASMPKQNIDEDQVKLKPFMGIRPGVYLTVLYSLFIIVIFFLFLIYPGLKNPRAVLVINTEPAGAAVRVNDVYMGLAGSRIIVPSGIQTIDVVMPGFEDYSAVYDIPGRIFGSLFIPRKKAIKLTLNTADPAEAFALYAADFAEWSFGGDPTDTYHIPLSLSEGAYRTGQRIETKEQREQIHGILKAASRFTVTRTALRDLIRTKILLDNSGNAPTAIISSISDVLLFLSETPGSAEWLADLLRDEAVIRASAWANNENEAKTDVFHGYPGVRVPVRLDIIGLGFISMNGFMISENPVPRFSFETFLNENPQWREHQIDYMPEEISFNPLEAVNRDMITGISWFAADAYCKWLSGRLPSSMTSFEVRLPTENEWEYASSRIANMRHQGFEWCADPFAPLPFIKAAEKAIQMVNSPEKSLSSVETRASLPPRLSSPLVTFRPVIAQKQD